MKRDAINAYAPPYVITAGVVAVKNTVETSAAVSTRLPPYRSDSHPLGICDIVEPRKNDACIVPCNSCDQSKRSLLLMLLL